MAQEWVEQLARRNRTSKTKRLYEDGQPTRKYSWDGMVGTSLHYEPVEGSGVWNQVDPRLVPSAEPGWDWEMQKSHWRFLVRNSGWFVAEKKGVGIGFRLGEIAYLNRVTKEYEIVRTATYGTPTVEEKPTENDLLPNSRGKLTWDSLFPGVDFELHVGPDGLHEEIRVSQAARDAMPAPSYPVADTYLVLVYEVDWGQVPGLADDEGPINYNIDFERHARLYLKNHQGEIITALPASRAWPEGEPVDEDGEPIQVPLLKRFIKKGANHYLLIGAPVLDLKDLPQGTIIFDPDVDEQVGAGADDGDWWIIGFDDDDSYTNLGESGGTYYNNWYRFTGISGLSGVTIDVAYVQYYPVYVEGAILTNIYCEDAAAPNAPTSYADVSGKTKTTNYAAWDATLSAGSWNTSPSVVSVIQELADDYDPSAIQILHNDDGSSNVARTRTYEYNISLAAKLHIEYTAGGGNEYDKAVAGALTFSGALMLKTSKGFGGTLMPAGVVGTVRIRVRTLSGTLTPTGALSRKTSKGLSGTLTSSGALVRKTGKGLAGVLTPSGVLTAVPTYVLGLAGVLTPSGTLVKKTSKNVAGTLTSAGAIVRKTSKSLAGTLAPSGILGTVYTGVKSLAGIFTPSGVVTTIPTFVIGLAGTLTTAGTLVKKTSKNLAGTLTSLGTLTTVGGRAAVANVLGKVLVGIKSTVTTLGHPGIWGRGR